MEAPVTASIRSRNTYNGMDTSTRPPLAATNGGSRMGGGVNQITITVKAGAPSAAELELAEGREQHYAGDAETDTSTAAN